MTTGKNFQVNYNPEQNMKNIYGRKLQKPVPPPKEEFNSNPFNKLMQPLDVTKSKRYVRDKLNISDIQGTKPDPYKIQKRFDGREYMEIEDIPGARPVQLKQNKQPDHLDYKLYTKDINPGKWQSNRHVDPLNPSYEMKTKSGRMMRIGQVENSYPKSNISPQTRRQANYVDDIQGTKPKRLNAVNDEQRSKISPESNYGKRHKQLLESRGDKSRQQYISQPRTENVSLLESPSMQNQLNYSVSGVSGYPGNSSRARVLAEVNKDSQMKIQQNQYNVQTSAEYQVGLPPKSKQLYGVGTGERPSPIYQRQSEALLNSRRLNNPHPTLSDNINLSVDLKKPPMYYPLGNNHVSSQDLSRNQQSPVRDRVWSKAREVGKEIVNSMGDYRITQNRSNVIESRHINAPKRDNFEQNIYEKGLIMNSGHRQGSQSLIMGSPNPINNEVQLKNVDVYSSILSQGNQSKADPRNSGINPITSLVDNRKQENKPSPRDQTKAFEVPTTSKMYGSFLDSNKIDQMISMLKQQKQGQMTNNIF